MSTHQKKSRLRNDFRRSMEPAPMTDNKRPCLTARKKLYPPTET